MSHLKDWENIFIRQEFMASATFLTDILKLFKTLRNLSAKITQA